MKFVLTLFNFPSYPNPYISSNHIYPFLGLAYLSCFISLQSSCPEVVVVSNVIKKVTSLVIAPPVVMVVAAAAAVDMVVAAVVAAADSVVEAAAFATSATNLVSYRFFTFEYKYKTLAILGHFARECTEEGGNSGGGYQQRSYGGNSGGGGGGGGGRNCFNCGSGDHISRDCSEPRNMSNVKCYNCQGNIYFNCMVTIIIY